MAAAVPRLRVNQTVTLHGRVVKVTCIVSASTVMVADEATGKRYETRVEDLTIPVVIDGQEILPPASPRPRPTARADVEDVADPGGALAPDLADAFFNAPYKVRPEDLDVAAVSAEDWAKAEARLRIIQPLLGKEGRTRAEIAQLAASQGKSTSSVYRWLRDYERSGDLASLLDRRPGPQKGQSHLSPEQDIIVRAGILRFLGNARLPVPDIYDYIEEQSKANQLPVPTYSTLTRRLALLPRPEVLRARGQKDEADKVYAPAIATRLAIGPMDLIQIDHTEADVVLVEEISREPIGRPWVTLAIDVYSRMHAGQYVSFDPPSAASVGMCIRNIVFEKAPYLQALGVPGTHPVHGRAGILHADNAREFRGQVLKQGCARHGMDLQFRPVKKPQWGAHIERLMGNLALLAARLPGKTSNSTRNRKGLKPEKEAAMTLKEFEAYLLDHFTNKYAFEKHSGIGTTPAYMFERGISGSGEAFAPRVPFSDEQKRRLSLDLLPYDMRSIQHYGIMLDKLTYYDPVLDPFIRDSHGGGKKKGKKYIVRFDPRDVSHVIFFNEETGTHHQIGLSKHGIPPFSRWEARAVRSVMEREGYDHRNERLFFETLARQRQRIADAQARTLDARALRQRESARAAQRAAEERKALLSSPEPAPLLAQQAPAPTLLSPPPQAESKPALPPQPRVPTYSGRRLRSNPFDDFGSD